MKSFHFTKRTFALFYAFTLLFSAVGPSVVLAEEAMSTPNATVETSATPAESTPVVEEQVVSPEVSDSAVASTPEVEEQVVSPEVSDSAAVSTPEVEEQVVSSEVSNSAAVSTPVVEEQVVSSDMPTVTPEISTNPTPSPSSGVLDSALNAVSNLFSSSPEATPAPTPSTDPNLVLSGQCLEEVATLGADKVSEACLAEIKKIEAYKASQNPDPIIVSSALQLAQKAQEGFLTAEFNAERHPISATLKHDFIFQTENGDLAAYMPNDLQIRVADNSPFDVTALGIEIVDNIAQQIPNAELGLEFGIPNQHLVFSKPIKLVIPTTLEEGSSFEVKVQHAGEEIGTKGITTDANATCNADGTSSNESNIVIVQGGNLSFYTCGASLFFLNNATGTAANPFTSLYDAYKTVTTAGIYYFNISGQAFSSYVDANGWVLMVSSDGSASGAYPSTTNLTLASDKTLPASVMSVLDVNQVRMSSTTGTSINVTSTNATVISRLKNFTSLGYTTGDHSMWSGTNAAGLSASCNGGSNTLNAKIWHSCGNASNLHWIPSSNVAGFASGANNTAMHVWARYTTTPLANQISLWLKADTGTNTTTNGTKISSWNDQSGNNNTFSQTNTSFQPTYVSSENSLFNFSPSLDFNGNGSLYAATQNLGSGIDAKIDAFFVANSENTSGYNGLMMVGTIGAAGQTAFSINTYNTPTHPLSVSRNDGTSLSSTSGFQGDTPVIAFGRYSGYGMQAAINGETPTSNTQTANISTNTLRIGEGALNGELYDGKMAEVIIFNQNLSPAERNKVESYLAAKYGITLDQTTGKDYLASDGTNYWNSTVFGTYKNNITVIGKDSTSSLLQKQSKSVNTAGLVTIGKKEILTTNQANTGTFAADKDFLSFADNNGALTWTSAGAPASRQILGRVFKVQETGTDATDYAISVPDNSSTLATKLPTEFNTVYLLQDNNNNFSSGAIEIPLTLNGTTWTASNIDLDNGQFFTFATDSPEINQTPAISITEGGAPGSIAVSLTVAPASNVVLNISSSDTTKATVSPATITFTSTNWNTPQIVSVTAVDDANTLNETVNVIASVNDATSSNEYDSVSDKSTTVTINDTDQAPVGTNDTISIPQDLLASIDVLINDSDGNNDILSIKAGSVTTPAHGTAVINGTKIDYTPTAGYVGTDSFSYIPFDGFLDGNITTVNITITDNTPPTAPTSGVLSPNPAKTGDIVTLPITGVEDGTTVTIPGMVCTLTLTDASGNVSCTATVGQNGFDGTSKVISVTDAAGNVNTSTSTPALTVDNTVPNAPTSGALSPNPAKTGDIVTLPITGVEDGTTVTIPGMVCTLTLADASGNVTCTATVGQNGFDGTSKVISVTDAAGNVNTTTSTPALTVDDTVPTAPQSTSRNNGGGYSPLLQIFSASIDTVATTPLHKSAEEKPTPCNTFTDTSNHWSKDYINTLSCLKVIDGKTAEKYAPDEKITRNEATKIAVLISGIPLENEKSSFADDNTPWASQYIATAQKNGIITGYGDGLFRGERNITRAEAIAILIRMLQEKMPEYQNTFSDVSNDNWYANYVAFAKLTGLATGFEEGTFRPNQMITRAEFSKMATLILDKLAQKDWYYGPSSDPKNTKTFTPSALYPQYFKQE